MNCRNTPSFPPTLRAGLGILAAAVALSVALYDAPSLSGDASLASAFPVAQASFAATPE